MSSANLDRINSSLPEHWQARTTQGGRIYYVNHHTQTTQWLPPAESWKSEGKNSLPYGWETGVDSKGKQYYINHVEKSTTRVDPRNDPDYIEPPQPREVELTRDPQMGFGFVAGSEKPVIVRFVTEDGPSEGKLLPGDQILKIDDEDVAKAPRERVIELVRSCEHSMKIIVCQPHIDNSARKSALLTAAKKAKLKNNPSRVRFAEAVTVNGAAVISPSAHESYVPFMPNVLKVFLENGQTKSFKYDNKTTVKDVIQSLQEKLNITAINHFALVLQNTKSSSNRLSILHQYETLADIASRPESQHFKCLFRVAFVPRDACDLLKTDSVAFDYFFTQCTNDVVEERFTSELKYDVALKLAALHIQQYYSASHSVTKLNLKTLQRDTGLDRFVPASVLESTKAKELRKLLHQCMKANEGLAPGQKQLTELQAKLQYVKILSQLKAFGGKVFVATFVEKKTEVMIVVGPRQGIAEVTNIKSSTFSTVADFSDIEYMTLSKENDSMQQVVLHLQNTAPMLEVTFSMLNDDVEEFIALVEGYYRLFVSEDKTLLSGEHVRNNNTDTDVPSYNSTHHVIATSWNYVHEQTTDGSTEGQEERQPNTEPEGVKSDDRKATVKAVDLLSGPPPYDKDGVGDGHEEAAAKDSALPSQGPDGIQDVTAPRADLSTQPGSASKSDTEPLGRQEVGGALTTELSVSELDVDGDSSTAGGGGGGGVDDAVSKDSDSVTGSSVSTVISASRIGCHDNDASLPTSPDGSTESPPMSRSMSAQDSRFGVSTFKTFATSPRSSPVLPRSLGAAASATAAESKCQVSALKAELDLKIKDAARKSADESDGESASADPEKAPLLGVDGQSPRKVKDDVQSESDTDSMSSPAASPAKLNLATAKLKTKETNRPQSFGLHSPEKLPCNEDEFNKLACSFGLHSPEAVPTEYIHPSYNPRLFSDGQLYFDPEIIDLTLIPPPVTPDEKDTLMDFSSPTMALPPPEFKDVSSPDKPEETSSSQQSDNLGLVLDLPSPIREKIDAIVQNDEDLGNQMAVLDALVMAELKRGKEDNEKESGIFENGSDSGNETISSENIELSHTSVSDVTGLSSVPAAGGQHLPNSLDTLDIDAFIASMTVPPPPKDSSLDTSLVLDKTTCTDSVLNDPSLSTPRSGSDSSSGLSYSSPSNPSALGEAKLTSTPLVSSLAGSTPAADDTLISELLSQKDYSTVELDDEIAKLVIPPPPDTSEGILTDIPVVPPVSEVHPPADRGQHEADPQEAPSEVAPYDSPTALEGSKLVESLRAEYESRFGGSVVHQRSSSVPDDRASGHDLVRRYRSLDPGAVPDPLGEAAASVVGSPYKKSGLWQPSVVSKSADSSPLHQTTADGGLAHSRVHNSIGTLPRLLRKKTQPPPPPPRRSSMQPQLEKAGSRIGENIADLKLLHHVVHQRSFSVPDDASARGAEPSPSVGGSTASQSPSTARHSVDTQSRLGKLSSSAASSSPAPSNPTSPRKSLAEEIAAKASQMSASRGTAQKVKARAATLERDPTGAGGVVQSTFVPGRESLISRSVTLERDRFQNLHDMLEVSRSVDNINIQAYKEYKRSSSASSSDSSKSSSTDSSTRFQAFKSKLKSYVAPSIYKKQQLFSRGSAKEKNGKSSYGDSELRKSEYLSTSGPSSPGPTSPRGTPSSHNIGAAFSELSASRRSPRNSPLLDSRHATFTDNASENKSSPKTFRTFLGDRNEGGASSPQKTAGIRTSLPHTKTEITRLKKDQVTTSPKRVSVPVVSFSTPSTTTTVSVTEQICPVEDSVTIPRGKVLLKVPSDEGSSSQDASKTEDKATPGDKQNSDQQDKDLVKENGMSGKVSSLRNELESKLDHKHFARKLAPVSDSGSEHVDEMLAALEVFTTYVQSHEYSGDTTFTDADHDVDHMVDQLMKLANKKSRQDQQKMGGDVKAFKDSLINYSRTFVTDSKLLVSSATQSRQKLIHHVNCSIHTLAKIVYKSGQIVVLMNQQDQMEVLGSKVKDVAQAYKVTMEAASAAAGKPLSDPNMKHLMKQATSLAAILSSFMKTLKTLEPK